MEFKEIQKIIKSFESSTLQTLELEQDGFKLKLSKATPLTNITQSIDPIEPTNDNIIITSPLVGTFYSAGGVNEVPFVQVGDIVEEGQVLCLVEAMKIMNEIIAPEKGEIKQIYVANKEAVGFHTPLMELVPYGK